MTLLYRRLLAPVMLILAAAFCAVGVAAGFELAWQTLVWIVISAGFFAVLAIIVTVHLYARALRLQVREALARAIPRTAAGSPSFAAPGEIASVQETLDQFAALFHQKLTGALHDQGQLLTIISSMSEGLVAVDRQQRILIANDAAQTLLGISLDHAQGKPLWEQVSVEGIATAASEVMLTGRPKTVRAGPVNGRHMEVMVSRLPASAGLVIVAHDITEATRYQRLREEFVANVSHELRTPLSVIKGFVETLRDGAIDDRERAIKYLDTVATHTEQLSNLVSDILDLSRLESREILARKDRVDVAAMLKSVYELMHPAAERKSQKLTLDIAGALPTVLGSAEYLGRAVGNVVENAIKYTRENGEVKIAARDEDGMVLISVEDNGIGISKEDLPRIFERFYRSDQSRSREMGGTGLGLSIVKHVVQGHGGSIDVTSKLGAGSKFVIKLPS